MGINMHIKDTWEVTMEELMSMLPNSKATKQVNKLMEEIESLKEENDKLNKWIEKAFEAHPNLDLDIYNLTD